MDPRDYIPAYLERAYATAHDDLTPAARALLHEEVRRDPERYATSEHARALLAYAQTHDRLMRELDRMEDLPDEEFERQRDRLFQEMRRALRSIWTSDHLCVDAQLVDILLADVAPDARLNDLLRLEKETRAYLLESVAGFDLDAPAFWHEGAVDPAGPDDSPALPDGPAELTRSNPEVVGWLHTLEALSQECLATARYRAAATYARQVMRAQGYPNRAVGTLLLALARLEEEDAFFEAARSGGDGVEDSPWYLLGRTLLLYKLGRRKNARRALKDFSNRCDGGAFFLLNPTYMTPYLPVRPEPREGWELSHQAVWEADGIIVDTPDFAAWAASIDGIDRLSEDFARRNGF